eukprot:364546-Chlamydomonas_euryale.AAC.7
MHTGQVVMPSALRNATLRSKAEAKARTLLGAYGKIVQEATETSPSIFERALAAYRGMEDVEPLESMSVPDSFFEAQRSLPTSATASPVKVKIGRKKAVPPRGAATRKRPRQASDSEDTSLLTDLTEDDVPRVEHSRDEARIEARRRACSGAGGSMRRATSASLPPLQLQTAASAGPVCELSLPGGFFPGLFGDATAEIRLTARPPLPKCSSAPQPAPPSQTAPTLSPPRACAELGLLSPLKPVACGAQPGGTSATGWQPHWAPHGDSEQFSACELEFLAELASDDHPVGGLTPPRPWAAADARPKMPCGAAGGKASGTYTDESASVCTAAPALDDICANAFGDAGGCVTSPFAALSSELCDMIVPVALSPGGYLQGCGATRGVGGGATNCFGHGAGPHVPNQASSCFDDIMAATSDAYLPATLKGKGAAALDVHAAFATQHYESDLSAMRNVRSWPAPLPYPTSFAAAAGQHAADAWARAQLRSPSPHALDIGCASFMSDGVM